jgi:membrane protease YdiL (CAAX protease family)
MLVTPPKAPPASERGRIATLLAVAACAAIAGAWAAHAWLGLSLRISGAWQALWVLAAAPTLEELVFRRLLQRELQFTFSKQQRIPNLARFADHWANAAASLAFAAAHIPTQGLQAWMWLIPSLLLGEVWRRTQRLPVCIALHAFMNAALAMATVF